MLLILSVDVQCAMFSLPMFTSQDNFNSHYMAIITLICDPGYIYTDGTNQRSVTCQLDGNWTPIIGHCVGKAII